MALQGICTPALIYIIFSLAQIVLDATKGMFNTAFVKFWISIIITVLLNYLCESGLMIISWIIVFIPFIMMTVITSILLLGLGLDPYKGKLSVSGNGTDTDRSKYDIRQKYMQIYKNKNTDKDDIENTTKVTGADIQNTGMVDTNDVDEEKSYAKYPSCTQDKILDNVKNKDNKTKCEKVSEYDRKGELEKDDKSESKDSNDTDEHKVLVH
jgi:hypothetical protein